jgi:[ribosomal protein S5]-alanine N-acetyltransferase
MKKIMKMKLIPINKTVAENQEFLEHPDCKENIYMSINFYEKVGYHPPWVSYYAQVEDELVGAAGFKGKPRDGKVEIAYGIFSQYQQQGIGTEICHQLVLLSLQTDPAVRITARTLQENDASGKILKKNGFELLGTVWDEEDGNVLEWEYKKT